MSPAAAKCPPAGPGPGCSGRSPRPTLTGRTGRFCRGSRRSAEIWRSQRRFNWLVSAGANRRRLAYCRPPPNFPRHSFSLVQPSPSSPYRCSTIPPTQWYVLSPPLTSWSVGGRAPVSGRWFVGKGGMLCWLKARANCEVLVYRRKTSWSSWRV